MTLATRYLQTAIQTDPLASGKMAFISGPRQCGKTTLSESILAAYGCPDHYFTWDDDEFKRLWLHSPKDLLARLTFSKKQPPLIVLDELHKNRKWKPSLKGFYDQFKNKIRIVVTGSARLNIYRRTGDSLAGRYIPYRLHPFTLGEAKEITPPPESSWERMISAGTRFKFDDLLNLGGFPEPLLGGHKAKADRWWRLYREQIIREDLRDLRAFKDLQQISNLVSLLMGKVGGGFSFQSIQEDLSVSFATVKDWIESLESVFFCFTIRPYFKRIQNSLRKEPKIYFFNWAAIQSPGARLENLVACHLLKSANAWTDSAQGEFDLFYIRDKYKREVDFCITRDGNPWLLVEVKSSGKEISPALIHYTDRLKPQFAVQLQEPGAGHKRRLMPSGSVIDLIAIDQFLEALN